jgi:hypothetical protein
LGPQLLRPRQGRGRAAYELSSGRQLKAASSADSRRAPSRDSILPTAFDTVAFERRSSAGGAHSATFAKMASPSKPGSLAMITSFETAGFKIFYF